MTKKVTYKPWKNIKKYCENCGNKLILKNNRDIDRKKFCNKSCAYQFYNKTNSKMRDGLKRGRSHEARKKASKTASENFKNGKYPKWENQLKKLQINNTKKDKKYCSVCGVEISKESINNLCKYHFNKNKSNGDYIKCKECGKIFYLIKSLINENGNFCSSKCFGNYQHKNRDSRLVLECVECGISFKRFNSQINGNNMFCSRRCSSIYYSRINKKNCHFYIDGRTSLRNLIKGSHLYKNWVYKILDRDGFKCKKCGESSNLNVHHINEFSNILNNFIKKYHDVDIEKNKELLLKKSFEYDQFWDIDNGITVCLNCHKEFHPNINLFKGNKKCR